MGIIQGNRGLGKNRELWLTVFRMDFLPLSFSQSFDGNSVIPGHKLDGLEIEAMIAVSSERWHSLNKWKDDHKSR